MNSSLETKFFEIRDRGTCMPAMAMRVSHDGKTPKESWLLQLAGYAPDFVLEHCILLVFLEINRCHFDPYEWNDRTRTTAHHYIEKNFNTLKSGDMIDIPLILGERITVKDLNKWEAERLSLKQGDS